ncbi:hypothetical protein [Actinospongicola halichondriae]|uniref:hypothetical protein n=1 Tax=Actinospongicola halichondriae TaxID=3236844 RepID=UPI003D5A0556
MGLTRLLVALVLVVAIGACGDSSDPSTAQRCRELEPDVSTAEAWEDIAALQEVVAEYMQLDRDAVLGNE